MDTTIKNWQQDIQEITASFKDSFQSLDVETLHMKPDAKTWSIAENIQHLIVLNESYFPIFRQLEKGNYSKPFIGNFGFLTKALGKMILKSVAPENHKKFKTLPIWIPSKYEVPENKELLDQFEKHQKNLSRWIGQLKPFLENKQVIHSPANRLIAYPLELAINIIISHEKRHYNQAFHLLEEIKK
ncbi:DinB family protein [Echinicola jeungdonensis]|uniref:DinB family protein n=1 Tax=Echinicola jeungdonensis TaxID=709343 RepID=A0ABV5J8P7_9BACT|nr:DinB family protein [Echinicola jeungdonensis]MDN3670292.1 DinB family protein [Echinicola jeungdonensis]MDN3670339.1 DinB family protein [Echinicola jeungdonensis]